MTAKSDRVKKLLDDPDLQEAWDSVEKKYIETIYDSRADDPSVMKDIRRALLIIQDVKNALQMAIEHGHLEDFRVLEQEGKGFLQDIRKWPNRNRKL